MALQSKSKAETTPTQSPDLDEDVRPFPQSKGKQGLLVRFGGHSASETPDPIPNSAVKSRCADGTASQDVGE